MNRLFLYFYVGTILIFGIGYNAICSENHHTGQIDALMLALKISHEGYDRVKSQIDGHSFSQWIRHKPSDGGCMNGLEWGTQYNPFIIECAKLQRDGSELASANSALSREVYKRIDEKREFISNDTSYNEFIKPRLIGLNGNTIDHCTYYAKKADGSIAVYTYFFNKAVLVALLNNLADK